jgi:hypothetical protein
MGTRLLKVDEDFNTALLQLKPILESGGWTALPTTSAKGVIVAPFEHSAKGRYLLEDMKFDGPGTCTLAFTPSYASAPQ